MTSCRSLQPFTRFGLGLLAVFALLPAIAVGDSPILENTHLLLRFDADNGQLRELLDIESGHDHIDASASIPLWSLEFMDGGRIAPAMANRFAWERPDDEAQAITLTWTDFHGEERAGLTVSVQVRVDATGTKCHWRIAVDGMEDDAPRMIHFPRIGGFAEKENEILAAPFWMGQKTRRARELLNRGETPGRWTWEHPGRLSLQCLTLYEKVGPGLALSSRDMDNERKVYAVFGIEGGGLGMEIAHTPGLPLDTPGHYETPYDTVVEVFNGDWFTAAESYREWAQEQDWVKNSRLKQGLTPDWVRDTGIWVWNRDHSPGVLEPAVALQEHSGLPVSVFWHWWHGGAYDAEFPEYFPPREGTEPFTEAVANAAAKGVRAFVYMNQRLWCVTTESWEREGAERYAVKEADGDIRIEVYNTFTQTLCAPMCIGTPFWRDYYADLAAQAINELGVAGVYMDQACLSLTCHDPNHEHPLGGGAWWMDGFARLTADIREQTADREDAALAGEGSGETWLPHLDAMLTLQLSLERYYQPGVWQPIPFFHAVYHDSVILYGSYSSLTRPPYDSLWPREYAPERPLELLDRKFAAQFRLEQARAFVWGQQPGIANFLPGHLEERDAELEFALRLARIRQNALPYLRDGVFLRPPDVDTPEREVPMSRLSIYAGQQDAVQEFAQSVPTVLASAWRAPSGTVAVVLASIVEEPAEIRLELEGPDYPLPESGVIIRITEDGSTRIGDFSGGAAALDVVLDGFDAAVYEFLPE